MNAGRSTRSNPELSTLVVVASAMRWDELGRVQPENTNVATPTIASTRIGKRTVLTNQQYDRAKCPACFAPG
jgi:hypothetical protein